MKNKVLNLNLRKYNKIRIETHATQIFVCCYIILVPTHFGETPILVNSGILSLSKFCP